MASERDVWDMWAKEKRGSQAVMMTSGPISKYRDFIERRALVGLLSKEIENGSKIIEVGCGNGRWMKRLIGLGYNDVFGFDFSRELVSMAERDNGNRCSVMDMYNIGLRNGVFDVALLLQVIPHGNADKLESIMFGVDKLLKGRAKIILMDEFPKKDVKELSSILSKKGYRLKMVKNVRSEAFHRVFRAFVRPAQSQTPMTESGYAKTSLKHYVKILFELPVDVLLSPFLKDTDLFLEKVLVFER